MFIIYGFGVKKVKAFGNFSSQKCENCRNDVNKQLLKVTTWFTLFFIPLIPYRREYLVVCPICNDAYKISKIDFEQLIEKNNGDLHNTNISMSSIGSSTVDSNSTQHNKYAGKTDTQIAYLKQMEELENEKHNNIN